jgi:hypothetical protein
MEMNRVDSGTAPLGVGMRRVAQRTAGLALQALRLSLYAVLALLRPILIPVLTWLAVGSFVLWVIFVPVAHDTGFPTLQVLSMSAGCAISAVLYYAAMEFLMPGSLGQGR